MTKLISDNKIEIIAIAREIRENLSESDKDIK
jgi:hypothetical protein